MSSLNNVTLNSLVVDLGALYLNTTGGGVFYVGSATQLAALGSFQQSIQGRTFSSVNAALANVVSGRGDVIYLLPGYTETISGADQWVNLGSAIDVSIVGMGHGTNRPTLTWSTSGSSVLFDVAGFNVTNCILQMEPTTGNVNVAAPITVSAAGCSITNCRINCGTDANNKVTIGITATSAADFVFSNNQVRGAALATCTTFLRLDGCANPVIQSNDIACGTTAAAVGPIQELNNACTGILIDNNWVHNRAASSTACITMALANTTGWISGNRLRNMTDTNLAWIVVTSGDVQMFDNKGVNNSNETALLAGTPSA